jgi:hypothetical protein
MTNWDDPESRLALIEQVGAAEYNRRHAEHVKASTVSTVNGHAIRPVGSRFGTIFMVGGTGTGYQTQEQAEAHARSLAPAGGEG